MDTAFFSPDLTNGVILKRILVMLKEMHFCAHVCTDNYNKSNNLQ
jgi:hypothetical protein